MKHKFFTFLIGTTLLATSLTGCIPIPQNPNSSNNEQTEQQNDDVQTEIEQNKPDNRVNQVVNNSLSLAKHYFYQPIMSLNGGLNYKVETSGVADVYKVESNTGYKTFSSKESVNSINKQNVTVNGNFDNIFFSNYAYNPVSYDKDQSTYKIVNEVSNKSWTDNNFNENYFAAYKDSSNIYAKYSANGEYIKDVNFDITYSLSEIMKNAYNLVNMDYDINLSNIVAALSTLYNMDNTAFRPYDITYLTIAEIAVNTIDYIHGNISMDDYIRYICTRIVHIDYRDIDQTTMGLINTVLAYVKTIDIDSLLISKEQENMIFVNFNYNGLQTIIDNLIATFETASMYLEEQQKNEILEIINELKSFKNAMPKAMKFERIFTLNQDHITNYEITLDIEGNRLFNQQTNKYLEDSNNDFYYDYDINVDHILANFSIGCKFSDEFIQIKK